MVYTWVLRYSPMQEEFENISVAVLIKKQVMAVFSCDANTVVRNRSFFMNFVSVCGEAR